jgi:hypothetical protein
MPYVICEECSGYYELEQGESPNDFEACPCGGTLKHVSVWGPRKLRFRGLGNIISFNMEKLKIFPVEKQSFSNTENLRFSSGLSYFANIDEYDANEKRDYKSSKSKQYGDVGVFESVDGLKELISRISWLGIGVGQFNLDNPTPEVYLDHVAKQHLVPIDEMHYDIIDVLRSYDNNRISQYEAIKRFESDKKEYDNRISDLGSIKVPSQYKHLNDLILSYERDMSEIFRLLIISIQNNDPSSRDAALNKIDKAGNEWHQATDEWQKVSLEFTKAKK